MPKKIDGEHLEVLRAAVSALDTQELRERYRAGDFPRSDLTRDVDRRYRWDLFYAAQQGADSPLRDLVWGGAYADTHYETALRSIVLPVEQDLPNPAPAPADAQEGDAHE
jgi:hypothetical protein